MTRRKKTDFVDGIAVESETHDRLFLETVQAKLDLIRDGLQRASDSLDKEIICPLDLEYAIKQMERADQFCGKTLRLCRVALTMFDGHSLDKSWKIWGHSIRAEQQERDALASLDSHIMGYRAQP